MRLASLSSSDFEPYGAFEIEDLPFFGSMMIRMIEDIGVMVGVLAKYRQQDGVSATVVMEALRTVDPAAPAQMAEDVSVSDVVVPDRVRDYLRPALPYDEASIVLIAKYVNRRLTVLLREAAAQAASEGVTVVKLRHLLPRCEEWPWPFNRWC